jgi:hypothetical protein
MPNDRIERLVNTVRPQPTPIANLMAEFNRLVDEEPALQGRSPAVRVKRAALLAEPHEANATAGWIRAARNP